MVLVDFWTYGCYNCVNTLPYVTKLYETYKDKGFVVVGIHTPEFPFERSAGNVQAALKRHGITYPVAQDNESAAWNAWRNQYWPAQYILDQRGNVVFSHVGRGSIRSNRAHGSKASECDKLRLLCEAGTGVPQPAFSATRFSTPRARGLWCWRNCLRNGDSRVAKSEEA